MTDLKSTSKLVKAVLEEDVQARNSDSILYLRVINIIAEQEGRSLRCCTIGTFLQNMSAWGYPPFESVRRARQKVQAAFPNLSACDRVEAQRMANVEKYKAYAQGVTV